MFIQAKNAYFADYFVKAKIPSDPEEKSRFASSVGKYGVSLKEYKRNLTPQ